MKLRNKKTGKRGWIAECNNYFIVVYPVNEKWEAYSDEKYVYHSLSEICEDWEDVKEPLIKDEKIRKAVRAWAEANELDGASCYKSAHYWYLRSFNDREQGVDINFWGYELPQELINNKYYTIEELCGSEE